MFKCYECGHIFDEGEEARWQESRGEFWGSECYEELTGCPLCGENYDFTTPCEVCGSEHFEDELEDGLCEECRKNRKEI